MVVDPYLSHTCRPGVPAVAAPAADVGGPVVVAGLGVAPAVGAVPDAGEVGTPAADVDSAIDVEPAVGTCLGATVVETVVPSGAASGVLLEGTGERVGPEVAVAEGSVADAAAPSVVVVAGAAGGGASPPVENSVPPAAREALVRVPDVSAPGPFDVEPVPTPPAPTPVAAGVPGVPGVPLVLTGPRPGRPPVPDLLVPVVPVLADGAPVGEGEVPSELDPLEPEVPGGFGAAPGEPPLEGLVGFLVVDAPVVARLVVLSAVDGDAAVVGGALLL